LPDLFYRFREWRADPDSETDSAIESKLKTKALAVENFPFEKVIEEFMVVKDVCPKKRLFWKKPQINKLYKVCMYFRDFLSKLGLCQINLMHSLKTTYFIWFNDQGAFTANVI
jgi:hypothetical protein